MRPGSVPLSKRPCGACRPTGQKPGPREMGPIIKAVQARIQTSGLRAEGRLVSEAVKSALAQ